MLERVPAASSQVRASADEAVEVTRIFGTALRARRSPLVPSDWHGHGVGGYAPDVRRSKCLWCGSLMTSPRAATRASLGSAAEAPIQRFISG
jgi:hypothetical protein